MRNSKTTQDPMLPLCKCFRFDNIINLQYHDILVTSIGGPTDIEDFLEFIEHPETHHDLQGSVSYVHSEQ
jgi:hypothetical protein